MTDPSEALHEEDLPADARDLHRALASLCEELEAVDWYSQRIEAASDPELRAILAHNRDEEVEHASMVLEWLRRNHPVFGRELAVRLGRPGPIVRGEHEDEEDGGRQEDTARARTETTALARGLGLGALRGTVQP